MIFGVAANDSVSALHSWGTMNSIPMHDITLPKPLSRCNVLMQAIGPVHAIKYNEENPVTLSALNDTKGVKDWKPLEKISIKHMPSEHGIEKVLLYIGAKASFRSHDRIVVRTDRAVGKGFLNRTKHS